MTLTTLCQEAHDNALAKGFYNNNPSMGTLLCQVHAELSEAFDSDRLGIAEPSEDYQVFFSEMADFSDKELVAEYEVKMKDCLGSELADAMIIIAGIMKHYSLDPELYIRAKMKYNATREPMHGKKY